MLSIIPFAILVLVTCTLTEALKERVSPADVDRVLATYESSDPPDLERSTQVRIGIYLNAMSIDTSTRTAQFSMYFRMNWKDPRLVALFDDTEEDVKKVMLSDDQIEKLWIPDVFIRNAKSSSKVNTLVNEQLGVVNRTGHVWFVVKLNTEVHTNKLMVGKRNALVSLMFESFKYTMDTLYFDWLDSPADVDKAIDLDEFTIKDVILYDCSQNYSAGAFPCMEMKFFAIRDDKESVFELGIYLMSSLLVFISWIGFWMPPSDKRVFLGLVVSLILAVLYTTVAEWREFSFAWRTALGQTWLIFCQALVLCMVFEFVLVYVLCGTLCDKLRSLRSGSVQEEVKQKPSRCTNIIDSVCGLVLFPLTFIIAACVFGRTTFAWI